MNRRIRKKRAKALVEPWAARMNDPAARAATRRGFRATPEEMGCAAVEVAGQGQRPGVLHRHRIRLPIHVAGPDDLVPILEERAAYAQDPETADALRTAAATLRTRALPDAIATLEHMASDPSRTDEWRGQAAGCLEAAWRTARET
jgi:hypothetical protein